MEQLTLNFEAEADELPSDAELRSLRQMVDDMKYMEDAVHRLEASLSAAESQLRTMQERTIPDRMQELRLTSFGLENGSTLTLLDDVFASIPKDKQPDAYCWLMENGYGALLKDTVTVVLNPQAEAALIEALADLNLDYAQKLSVHAGTFKAFAKERLRAGVSLPEEFFTVYDYKKAVVKTKKATVRSA